MSINDLQLQELRRFAELGRISASMLHEISNPLSAALLQLELSDHSSPAVRKAKRNMQTLRNYIEAARQQISGASSVKLFSIQAQLEQLKIILMPLAQQAGVTLKVGPLANCLKMSGDPIKFQQIITNLVMNAVQAYDNINHQLETSIVKLDLICNDEWLIIKVQDWGKGILPSELPKVFEPFYTTKSEHTQGLGIGLSLVKQSVINDFEGSIKVTSSPQNGTCFTVKMRLHNKKY
jgi:signal transduction histidine kinase